MEEIQKALGSPAWWVLTIIFGLMVSVLANFITRRLDAFFAKWSKAWRENSEKRNDAFMQKAWELAKDDEAMRVEWEREVRHRLKALTQVLFSVAIMIVLTGFPPPFVSMDSWAWRIWASAASIAGIIFMISVGNYLAAGNVTAMLTVARDLRVREILPEIERQRAQEAAREQ